MKIGPVFSVENKPSNGNCVACSRRRSTCFIEYIWSYWPIFAVFSPYESPLHSDDGSVSYFPICQGTLPWLCCRNEGKLILHAFFSRLPDCSTVSFCYYLLGGDTAAPSGLLARLCHAFLVANFLINLSVQEFWKSVSSWWSYGQKSSVLFYWFTVYNWNY